MVRANAGSDGAEHQKQHNTRKLPTPCSLPRLWAAEAERKSSTRQQKHNTLPGERQGVLGNLLQYSNGLGEVAGANVLYV